MMNLRRVSSLAFVVGCTVEDPDVDPRVAEGINIEQGSPDWASGPGFGELANSERTVAEAEDDEPLMIAAIEAPNGATLRFIDEGESVGVVEKTRASASYTEFMRRSGATPLELFLELADPSIPIPAALEGDHLAYVDREPRPIELPDELLMEPDPMAADNCDLGSNFAGYDSFCADWIAAYGYNNEHCFEIDSHGDQHYGVIGKATYSYNGTHCGYAALGACNASNSIDQLAVFKRKAVYNTAPVPGLGWEDVYAEILYQGDRSIYCPGSGAQAYHYAVTTEHDDEGTVRVKLAGSWATCPFVSCI